MAGIGAKRLSPFRDEFSKVSRVRETTSTIDKDFGIAPVAHNFSILGPKRLHFDTKHGKVYGFLLG